jgi:2-polyprenyl-6-methoxyphenol hydroxylase-like FAD-dependent oxidoreductase
MRPGASRSSATRPTPCTRSRGRASTSAFLDAAALVDVLGEAVAAGDDPGELRVLRRYERWRKG